MIDNKPLVINLKLKGGRDSVIPKGAIENLRIEVIDEGATFHFINSRTCKMFAIKQRKDGVESKYIERLQKTICSYPGMNKTQIAEHITNRLKALSGGSL